MRKPRLKLRIFQYALLLLVPLLQFRSVISPQTCLTKTVAQYGDGFNTIWNNRIMVEQGFPPWQSSTIWANSPFGEPFWTIDWWSSFIPRIMMYFFSTSTNPICGYNLAAFFGVAVTAISFFCLLLMISENFFLSYLASLVIILGPYLLLAVPSHVHKTHMWAVFLPMIFAVRAIRHDRRKNLLALGIVGGLCSYVDGYFTIMILIIFVSFSFSRVRGHNLGNKHYLKVLDRMTMTLFIWFIVCLPLLYLTFTRPPSSFKTFRSQQELEIYRAKYWHYLYPGPQNPYVPTRFTEWASESLDGSNFAETGLYITWTFLIFTTLIQFIMYLRKNQVVSNSKTQNRLPVVEEIRTLDFLSFFRILALVSVSFSSFSLFWNQIFNSFPYFRTISRIGILVTISILALGVISIAQEFQRKKANKLIKALLVSILLIELGVPSSVHYSTFVVNQELQQGYIWLKDNSNREDVVLEYKGWSVGAEHLGMAAFHGKRLANPWRPNTFLITEEFLDNSELNFLCFLYNREIRFVVVHKNPEFPIQYKSSPSLLIAYEGSKSVRMPDVDVYEFDRKNFKLEGKCALD